MARRGEIEWIGRGYEPGDLQGAFLVIAIRHDAETNRSIFAEAEAGNALVNVMDDVPNCNFVAGSVVRRGPLVIAISTSGAAPALAVRLRERFEREIGAEYGQLLEILRDLRDPIALHHPDFDERRRLWYRLVDSELLQCLRDGDRDRAGALLEEMLGFEVELAEVV
jgi:precorrin-2 dehydrogenase / sirohydrochlorin ferrochelatase